jgi:hypothetical protein
MNKSRYIPICKPIDRRYLACKPGPCGEVLLPYAAILSLHFLDLSITPSTSIDEMTEFQKIVDAKR